MLIKSIFLKQKYFIQLLTKLYFLTDLKCGPALLSLLLWLIVKKNLLNTRLRSKLTVTIQKKSIFF